MKMGNKFIISVLSILRNVTALPKQDSHLFTLHFFSNKKAFDTLTPA
jgi:hypothetical protein